MLDADSQQAVTLSDGEPGIGKKCSPTVRKQRNLLEAHVHT